jgi:peptidyl-prolyl cis-trans isomerase A (cyclophilin A)
MKGIGIILAALVLALVLGAAPVRAQGPGPVVVLETSKGTIMVLLDPVKAPVSVENFLKYVDAGFYDGTLFHRVIKGFMIQGGGFDTSLRVKPTMAPIRNESGNGLENRRGTIAMARTNDLDSATSQFYINHVDNAFLDTNKYCVFGKVLRGMNVVDAIADVPTGNQGGMADVPREQVVILRAYRHQG